LSGHCVQLTAATAAMVTKVSTSVHSELTLQQFISVGILLQFESLVSCHGDEMGMLEDMDTALHDLAGVRFTVSRQTDVVSTSGVSVTGSRSVDYFTHH